MAFKLGLNLTGVAAKSFYMQNFNLHEITIQEVVDKLLAAFNTTD